jgi:hypothetical protein
VRQITDTRTAKQLASALFWHLNQSVTSQAAMQGLARELIVRYRRMDAEAARILFLGNATAFDAMVGCFDAKYHYRLIRPPQAEPLIVTTFPTPAHPSYPSAHSCISGGMTETLARTNERHRLEAVAQEASLSRLYAGIHYRSDTVVGLALGRAVAAKAWRLNLDDVAPLP